MQVPVLPFICPQQTSYKLFNSNLILIAGFTHPSGVNATCHRMVAPSIIMKRTVFFLGIGLMILLATAVVFLYKETKAVQVQNRQLIIQNDSIISVNILLADSIKRSPANKVNQKSFVHRFDTQQK